MLSNRTMLVVLNVSQPKQEKVDRAASVHTCEENGTDRDAARVVKVLFDPASYRPIKQTINKIRTYHYDHTLPWLDAGPRILSSAMFLKYNEDLREMRYEFDSLVDKFCAQYEHELERGRERLHGLFNESDYPSLEEVRNKFNLEISFSPIPDAEDFRVDGIDDNEAEKIREQLQQRQDAATSLAMQEAYNRLHRVVKHMAESLSDADKKFKNTLVQNVRDLVEILPALNITEDKKLAEFIEEVEAKLAPVDPEDLRTDEKLRGEICSEAQAIINKMQDFM